MNDPGPLHFTLPHIIDVAAGDTASVYLRSTVQTETPGAYTFQLVNGPGFIDATHWEWTPAAATSAPLELTVSQGATVIGRAHAALRVSGPPPPATPIRLLLVGDSLTWQNFYPNDLYARFVADGIAVTMLGSSTGDPGNPLVPGAAHEGFSGYAYKTFVDQGPFVFLEGGVFVLDFARWVQTTAGGVPPDVCVIVLGINDITSANRLDQDRWTEASLSYADRLIANMLEAAPDMLIGTSLITPPNPDPAAWPATIYPFSRWLYTRQSMLEGQLSHEYLPRDRLWQLGTSCGIDPAVNFADNVHPNAAGYAQLADQVYASILSRFPL